MLFKNPYRILFLHPVYQRIISASNLLGILVGMFLFCKFTFGAAALWNISMNIPIWQLPNPMMLCFTTALVFPLSFYLGIILCAAFSGTYLILQKEMQPRQLISYMLQTQYPPQWFAKTPTF